MKEKLKRVASRSIALGIGVVCDAALIHNFFYQDRWNLYCQRYISVYTAISWLQVVTIGILSVYLEVGVRNEDFRKKNEKTLKDQAESSQPRLWKTLWRFLEHVPMTVFVGIFVGNIHLFVLWTLITVFSITAEKSSAKLLEIFKKGPPTTFTEVMKELDKKSSLN